MQKICAFGIHVFRLFAFGSPLQLVLVLLTAEGVTLSADPMQSVDCLPMLGQRWVGALGLDALVVALAIHR